jgi:hypothetical protein
VNRGATALQAVRLGWAIALLASPDALLSVSGGQAADRSRAVAHLLGARHAVQGVAGLMDWPRTRRPGIAVDLLHAASALALATLDRRWRRVALGDAAVATGFALAGATVGS